MSKARSPEFLYPQSRQFSFDQVCEEIVCALAERNFEVPGLEFEFHGYGQGKFRILQKMIGANFRLHFGRRQGYLKKGWNNIAAVSRIVIPRRELYVNEDGQATFFVYAGSDWERDARRFLDNRTVNGRQPGQPRLYLQYSGGCQCNDADVHVHPGVRQPFLFHDRELGRQHELVGDEPISYNTEEVFAEFAAWLRDNVLAMILEQPVIRQRAGNKR